MITDARLSLRIKIVVFIIKLIIIMRAFNNLVFTEMAITVLSGFKLANQDCKEKYKNALGRLHLIGCNYPNPNCAI